MWEYKGKIYSSKKELRDATGFSGCKIKAKQRDNEIKLIINHTGVETYEEIHNDNN